MEHSVKKDIAVTKSPTVRIRMPEGEFSKVKN
jgi:hypothetical protein